jgi:thiamine pyrophosphokinase
MCVFITAVPITKLFAWGGAGTREDMCYERLRAEACVDVVNVTHTDDDDLLFVLAETTNSLLF